MKSKAVVSRHYRKVKGKKIPVRRHSRKVNKPVRVMIKKDIRKVLNHISDPKNYNKEFGGGIDYQKNGKLDNFLVIPGKPYSVDIPFDYEVYYHTHPNRRWDPPSPDDLIALLDNNKQQAEVVVKDGKIFVIKKSDKTKKLFKGLSDKKKFDTLWPVFEHPESEEKVIKGYKNLGFKVKVFKKSEKPAYVEVVPKEPRS